MILWSSLINFFVNQFISNANETETSYQIQSTTLPSKKWQQHRISSAKTEESKNQSQGSKNEKKEKH